MKRNEKYFRYSLNKHHLWKEYFQLFLQDDIHSKDFFYVCVNILERDKTFFQIIFKLSSVWVARQLRTLETKQFGQSEFRTSVKNRFFISDFSLFFTQQRFPNTNLDMTQLLWGDETINNGNTCEESINVRM